MTEQKPTVVLIHGAFAESASWNGVVERLQARSVSAVAVANPLRSLPGESIPSWFVFGAADLNIPVALHRFMADRAGAKSTREVSGASHALSVSQPQSVTDSILEAVEALGA
jgi:pimeloyl-ACP methyl ester carboxylesterase